MTAALEEYVRHRRAMALVAMFGTVEWDDDYDYKAARRHDAEKLARRIEEWNADEPGS